MPITLPPLSRRRFLAGSLAAATALLTRNFSLAAEPIDSNRFALLSDTHIDADPMKVNRNANMHDNLLRVCGEVAGSSSRPGNVLICGDLAHLKGEPGDYATLLKLLTPVREKGMPIHLALGNHDHRTNFWKGIEWAEKDPASVADRHLTIIESPHANWFILDSLDKPNITPGIIGDAQFKWLAAALETRQEKPAIIMVHHNPDTREKPSGLTDTKPLMDLLLPRKHVKALIFGHTHDWNQKQQDGLHLVNLPPTAYVFGQGKPNGWVDCRLSDQSATLELRSLDPAHPQHGQKIELPWR